MQSRQQVVDSEEGKQYQPKANYDHPAGCIGRPIPAPVNMQVNGIDYPGYQSPGFFGIPGPVPAPGLFGPDSPENDRQGQQGKTSPYQ